MCLGAEHHFAPRSQRIHLQQAARAWTGSPQEDVGSPDAYPRITNRLNPSRLDTATQMPPGFFIFSYIFAVY